MHSNALYCTPLHLMVAISCNTMQYLVQKRNENGHCVIISFMLLLLLHLKSYAKKKMKMEKKETTTSTCDAVVVITVIIVATSNQFTMQAIFCLPTAVFFFFAHLLFPIAHTFFARAICTRHFSVVVAGTVASYLH